MKQCFGSRLARRRILAGNEQPVDDDIRLEHAAFAELGTLLFEHVFEQERNDISQSDGFLFGIGKAGELATLGDRLAVGRS